MQAEGFLAPSLSFKGSKNPATVPAAATLLAWLKMSWRFRAATRRQRKLSRMKWEIHRAVVQMQRERMADRFPFNIRVNPTYLGVLAMKDMLQRIARGEQMMGLFCGGTGIGKTFFTRQICRKCGIKEVPEERPIMIDSLVSFFWLHRESPVLLLDECDHLLRQESTCNMLKLICGNPRVVAHATRAALLNEQYQTEGSGRFRNYIPATRFLLGDRARPVLLSNENYQNPEVTARLPQVHWTALVGRGLDPIWIPTSGNEGRDLFEYTYWLAVEGRMLRSWQFTWDASRKALAFYIDNIHKLADIHPRRLVLIAQVFCDVPHDRDKQASRLQQMLRDTDQRPKDIIPTTWVSSLYLPHRPPSPKHPRRQHAMATPRPRPPSEPKPNAARHTRGPEAAVVDYDAIDLAANVHIHQTGEPPVLDHPVPHYQMTPPAAIDAVYRIPPHQRTLESVRAVLWRFPLDQWDEDERNVVANACCEAGDREHEHQSLAEAYFIHEPSTKLFGDSKGVLQYEDGVGLNIYSWDEARQRIAPELEKAAKAAKRVQRQQILNDFWNKQLPPVTKLKAVRQAITDIRALDGAEPQEDVACALAYVAAMSDDDPQFTDCKRVVDYLRKALTLARRSADS